MGLEDPSLSLQSAVPPLGQESSRQEFEQWSHQSEPSDKKVQKYVWEAQHRASHQDTLDCISVPSSRPQEVSNHRLGLLRECMLRDWYQPECGSVWVEQKVFNKLDHLN